MLWKFWALFWAACDFVGNWKILALTLTKIHTSAELLLVAPDPFGCSRCVSSFRFEGDLTKIPWDPMRFFKHCVHYFCLRFMSGRYLYRTYHVVFISVYLRRSVSPSMESYVWFPWFSIFYDCMPYVDRPIWKLKQITFVVSHEIAGIFFLTLKFKDAHPPPW